MQKHILIIGGMGPQASIHAHKRLIETYQEHYQNTGNSDYPRITHLSLNVEDFISDETKKEAAKNYILTCLKEIDMSSVDVGFIACNAANNFFYRLYASAIGR
jgi:aspartate racemase